MYYFSHTGDDSLIDNAVDISTTMLLLLYRVISGVEIFVKSKTRPPELIFEISWLLTTALATPHSSSSTVTVTKVTERGEVSSCV